MTQMDADEKQEFNRDGQESGSSKILKCGSSKVREGLEIQENQYSLIPQPGSAGRLTGIVLTGMDRIYRIKRQLHHEAHSTA